MEGPDGAVSKHDPSPRIDLKPTIVHRCLPNDPGSQQPKCPSTALDALVKSSHEQGARAPMLETILLLDFRYNELRTFPRQGTAHLRHVPNLDLVLNSSFTPHISIADSPNWDILEARKSQEKAAQALGVVICGA